MTLMQMNEVKKFELHELTEGIDGDFELTISNNELQVTVVVPTETLIKEFITLISELFDLPVKF